MDFFNLKTKKVQQKQWQDKHHKNQQQQKDIVLLDKYKTSCSSTVTHEKSLCYLNKIPTYP